MINKTPDVSVVMRTCNCFSGISPFDPSAAIKSLLVSAGEIKGDVELIVLDDGSTDRTLEAVREFGEAVRFVELGKMGPIPLLNLGIHLARAPLVACFDSDDVVGISYFERLMEPFAWSACAYAFCDNFEREYGGSPESTIVHRLHGNPYLGTVVGGVIFRRSVLLEAGGYDATLHTPDYYAFPECDLLMKLEKQGCGSSYVPEPLWTYVRRPSSMSAGLRETRMERGKEVLMAKHGWLPDIRSY